MTATTVPRAAGDAVAAPTPRAVRERTELRLVRALAVKELRDSLRDRWFWLYTGAFAVLAIAITSLAVSDAEVVGFGGFGRTAASLVALVQLVVPLMGLTLGARTIADQRERGTLAFLLAHPVNRTEVFLGVYFGNAIAMLAAVAGGFGVAGLVAGLRDAAVDGSDLLAIAALSWLLAVAMIGLGMLVSVCVRRSATAIGGALFLWLVLVFVGDLGVMGTAVATRMPEQTLFFTAVSNPVEAFRLSAMTTLDGSLDVLGPVGTYAIDRFGDGVRWITLGSLVLWAVVPAAIGALIFRRGTDL